MGKKVKKKNKKSIPKEWKLFFLSIGILVFTAIIIGRMFYLQIIKGSEWSEIAEKQYTARWTDRAKRGRILSSDGEVLAYDVQEYELTIDPTAVDNKNLGELTKILKKYIPEINEAKFQEEVLERKKSEKKYLPFTEISTRKDIILNYETKKELEDEILKVMPISKTGIAFLSRASRNYISNNAFQEIVGFSRFDQKEQKGYGIERYFDEDLTGTDGLIENFKRIRGFSTAETIKRKKETVAMKDGNNVILTIDSNLQYILDEEMKKVQLEYRAESSMGILMEVETGKILAMSTYPKGEDNGKIKNRPVTDLFEPGSIFKPITIAMGLQEGVINENSTVFSNGTIKVADRIIKDHDNTTYGTLTLEKLISHSGNVGMVRIAQMIENQKFYDYLSSLGFGTKTGINTYTEFTQKLFPLKNMTPLKKAQISFGQGINMTQLQIMMALNTVINDGKLMRPYIVDRIEDVDGKVQKQIGPQVIRNVFSPEVSRINRKLMEAVVEKGTGKKVQIPGYRIGGKTGTAQKAGPRGYEAGKYFSSFFSFFPVDKPKYAILVTVNEPKGGYYGAEVALPPVKAVFEKLIKYKGIDPEGATKVLKKSEEVVMKRELKRDISRYKTEFNMELMPDLTGLSLREIFAIYPRNKFPNYKINGTGRVIGQYPKAGTKISKTSQIIINME